MRKIECKYGYIGYEVPDIADYLIMMGEQGFQSNDFINIESANDLVLMGKLIKAAGSYVEEVSIEIDGRKIEDYKACMKEIKLMEPLLELAGKLQEVFQGMAKKKS